MSYYLRADAWQELYQSLLDEDPTGDLAGQFDDFFDDPSNGYYHLTNDNISAYENWLKGLFGDNPQDWLIFVSWDPNYTGISGQQGGGFNISPIN